MKLFKKPLNTFAFLLSVFITVVFIAGAVGVVYMMAVLLQWVNQ